MRGRPLCFTPRQAIWLAAALALLRTGLSAYWAFTLPPFEAHDETGHFEYARFIASKGRLPDPGHKLTEWFDESHQPPLYYVLAAIAGRHVAPSEPYTPIMNPFFLRGDKLAGANAVLHDPAAEAYPGTPPQRFLLAGRLVSAALSGAAVFLVFLVARRVVPDPPGLALAATGLAAFNPTWVYLGGAMNNDALVAFMGALVLWSSLRLLQSPFLRPGDAALAGLALGLALMSKNNAIMLAPFGVIAVGLAAWRTIPARHSAFGLALFIASVVVVSGWWYARNLLVLGRPLSDRETANVILREVSPFFEIVSKRDPLEFVRILFDNSFRTYWGQFGWGTIGLPDGIYVSIAAVVMLALVGLLLNLRTTLRPRNSRGHVPLLPPLIRGTPTRYLWILIGFTVLVAALPLYRAIFFNTPTLFAGRYLLPGAAAISILLALGLFTLGRGGVVVASGSVLALFAISALAPSQLILPEYLQPPRLSLDEARSVSTQVDFTYDGRGRLIGYRFDTERLTPGQELTVTLYWQVIGTFERPYTMGLHLIDLHSQSRASLNSWPGRGNFATSLWTPGEVFADTYRVKIPPSAAAPFVANVRPKLHDFSPITPESTDFRYHGDLPVTDAAGRPIEPVLGLLAIESPAPPPGPRPLADFGSAIRLENFALSRGPTTNDLQVQLTWEAMSRPADAFVVFVHVVDGGGRIVAQSDAEPATGLYPTTVWRPGERIVDGHPITLPDPLDPAAPLRLAIGLYRRADLQRLPAMDAQGQPLPLSQLIIETPYPALDAQKSG